MDGSSFIGGIMSGKWVQQQPSIITAGSQFKREVVVEINIKFGFELNRRERERG